MPDTDRYVERLQAALDAGDATEHTHRPALQDYIESFGPGIVATNEPRRGEAGAPDYSVGRRRGHGLLLVGKIEAKDIGTNLNAIQVDAERVTPRTREGRQFRKYRRAFENLVLTDYVDFRWYRRSDRQADPRLQASIATSARSRLIARADGIASVETLLNRFISTAPQRISNARTLAERMAGLTDLMQEVVLASIRSGTVSQRSKALQQAFRGVLVSDLTDEAFADMFCQTIAYGLFAARVRHSPTTGPFERRSAAADIPRTNPFLRHLFSLITGPDLDEEPFAGLVDDLVQLFEDTDMARVMRDFGAQARQDPIVHFYETFLGEYNPELRDVRGVYYTPKPVVSYIVNSIDGLLVDRFDARDGLADTGRLASGEHRVLVLDPALGTGTFLYEVIDLVRERISGSGMAGAWPSYVRQHLLPRLFGFEIMMAPYAVAHLKIGLQLAGLDLPENERADWAYDFEHDDRVGVYLTNTLDPGETATDIPFGEFISDEANAAALVKTDRPIMVVLGNPPYQAQSWNTSERILIGSRGRRRRERTFIGTLIRDYHILDGAPLRDKSIKFLQDDYVKFIRFGQWRIDQTNQGILGFVTNHTYLGAPTFRGMRESLLRSFDDIYVIDLHGSIRNRERNPNGGDDENVFDQIQQGVAIAIFIKSSGSGDIGTVHYHERWGTKDDKYRWLNDNTVGSTEWVSFIPVSPFYGFQPEDANIRAEWNAGTSLTDIFPTYTTGLQTSHDGLVIDTREDRLRNRIADFLDPRKATETVRSTYFPGHARTRGDGTVILQGDTDSWKLTERRAALQAEDHLEASYQRIMYRPFDERFILYHPDALERDRREVMRHLLEGPNMGLASARSNKSPTQDQFLATRLITEVKTAEATTGSVMFPLWLYSSEGDSQRSERAPLFSVEQIQGRRRPNIGREFTTTLENRLGFTLVETEHGNLDDTIGPQDVFDYIYGVVHSRTYRLRYADFLRREHARIPVTGDREVFRELCRLGQRLVSLCLLESPDLSVGAPAFPVGGTGEITAGFPRWVAAGDGPPDGTAPAEADRLYINGDGSSAGTSGQYFAPVAQEVWEYNVGGHPVVGKWLKARRGDHLVFEEIKRLSRMMNAIWIILGVLDEIEERVSKWPLP